MADIKEIKARYKRQHDELSDAYYGGTSELTKEEFDIQHGQVWNDMEAELTAEGFIKLPEPPKSTHISTLVSVDVTKARPANVKRVWEGRDYFYDCFVTEAVKDQYLAGQIIIGDHLLVHFDTIGEQIVTDKVFKSW